jgi:hypothetical protein
MSRIGVLRGYGEPSFALGGQLLPISQAPEVQVITDLMRASVYGRA